MALFVLPSETTKQTLKYPSLHVIRIPDKDHQKALFSTLRMFKLCMCNVNKCKLLAVRSCHGEVGFCFIHILNSNERKKNIF